MTTQTPLKPKPVARPTPAEPVSPAKPVSPAVEQSVFEPSADLGEQLERLQHEQADIDRRAAEELARLRELQDRD